MRAPPSAALLASALLLAVLASAAAQHGPPEGPSPESPPPGPLAASDAAASSPGGPLDELDARVEFELDSIVYNNVSAALQWFNTPKLINADGDTTLLHGVERVYGPKTIANMIEVNRIIIKAAKQAFAALQIKLRTHYVVVQSSGKPVAGFPRAKEFEGFDQFFSVSLAKGVTLRAPLTADLVQLGTTYIRTQLQARSLASGMMLVGVVLPPDSLSSETVAPTSLFQSIFKVSPALLLPFVLEKQTMLLTVLHELNDPTSPVACINITQPHSMRLATEFPLGRKMLAANASAPDFFYISVDMLLVPAGPTPMELFGELLAGDRFKTLVAEKGLPMSLEWVNSTVTQFELSPSGEVTSTVTIYQEEGLQGSGSEGLAPAVIAGIAVAAAALLAIAAAAGLFAAGRWRRARRSSAAATAATAQADSCTSQSGSLGLSVKGGPDTAISYSMMSRAALGSINHISPEEITICKREDGSDWLLGSGSFGQVFKGMRRGVQEVAVKKLRPATDDSLWFNSLIREITIMSSVSYDRNVVQYYGASLEGADSAMLIMEFCGGGDLRQAYARDESGAYTWAAAGRGIVLDIARGLHFLHASGVVHRDLKTANILLTAEGVAKIADVGLAKVMTAADPGSWDRTAGTFCYAAPELILGVRCTEKADIYSMGVILWEICTQEMPIRGQLRDVLVPDEAPAQISTLIDECLQPNPARRPTAFDLYERIKAIPAGPKKVLRRRSAGPLARNIGRNNGQKHEEDGNVRGGSSRFRDVSESLLAGLV